MAGCSWCPQAGRRSRWRAETATPPPPPGGGPPRTALLGEAISAGLIFLAGPAAGWFLGRLVGSWFGASGTGAWVGAVLGLAAAFTNFFRFARRVSR